eukprot:1906750-Pyramimonas_sp.AAC.1
MPLRQLSLVCVHAPSAPCQHRVSANSATDPDKAPFSKVFPVSLCSFSVSHLRSRVPSSP